MLGLRGAWRTRGTGSVPLARTRENYNSYMDAWDIQRAGEVLGNQEGSGGSTSWNELERFKDMCWWAHEEPQGRLQGAPRAFAEKLWTVSSNQMPLFTRTVPQVCADVTLMHPPLIWTGSITPDVILASFLPTQACPRLTCCLLLRVNIVSSGFPLNRVSVLDSFVSSFVHPCGGEHQGFTILWFWFMNRIPMDKFSASDAWLGWSHFFFF